MKLLVLFFFLFSNSVFSQTINDNQKDSLIAGIKKAVLENYVITEKAILVSDSLNAKTYSGISTIDTLLKKLNADLFHLSNDKHLFLDHNSVMADNLIKKADIHAEQNKKEKKEHYGFAKREILPGNIGYLKLDYFADTKDAKKEIFKYTRYYKKTDALIIDVRNNFGGNGSMLQLLSGIFLPDSQNEILKINYKSGRIVTMKAEKVNRRNKLSKIPVFVLCNDQTYSAGEAFTLILKNRHRAIIIGETTAGGGNVAGPHAINNGFVLTIPVGTIVDPLTNIGWEHTGVTPDVIVKSDAALKRALEMIKKGK